MEFLDSYYHETEQNLVKQRHYYADCLARGYDNRNIATINIIVDNKEFTVRTKWAAQWLDRFFQKLISGNPRSKIEKDILKLLKKKYISLQEIKDLLKIEVIYDKDIVAAY